MTTFLKNFFLKQIDLPGQKVETLLVFQGCQKSGFSCFFCLFFFVVTRVFIKLSIYKFIC